MSESLPIQFINRVKEQDLLKKHFASIPNAILWLSGPESCGKSHLIEKVIKELDQEKYAINYLNLRTSLIYDFQSFLNIFFKKDEKISKEAGRLIPGLSFNTGFCSVNSNDDEMLKKNAFKVIEDQIRQAKSEGIQPIIILDEIQALKKIYLNEDQYLVDAVFNLFVRLTKETHLAHIVCITSDTCFMWKIFMNAKLAVTSIFYDIEHFSKITVENWLKEEGLKDEEIAVIYDYCGGCPWNIWQILEPFKKGGVELKTLCEDIITKCLGQIYGFRRWLPVEDEEMFNKVNQSIINQGYYEINDKDYPILNKILVQAIEEDIWFYRAETRKITANSRIIQKAMERM